jgi:hypothetical protein
MSTAVPARTNRSGSASPAMRCRPETSCLRQPARGQTHTSPCALSADRQRSGTQLLWIEQRSRAEPLVGSKPESMIVPRGARRSDQKAHPSRLEQACRFLRSWSCEFDSRPPLQQRNAWSGASLPRAMRLYHGNRARAITWAISPGGQGLSHATLENSPRVNLSTLRHPRSSSTGWFRRQLARLSRPTRKINCRHFRAPRKASAQLRPHRARRAGHSR